MSRPLLTLDQVAEHLAITRRTVERMIQRGDLATIRVSERSLRVGADELDRYIAQQTARAAS